MSGTTKLFLGAILGYAGYIAYKKLQKTQTVVVSGFDRPIPDIIGAQTGMPESMPLMQSYPDYSAMAGWR